MARDYPVCLRIEGRRCVVVGGGRVGEERVRGLVDAGAAVTVVAERPGSGLQKLASEGAITLHRRRYEPGDLKGAFLAIAATDDPGTNAAVRSEAQERSVLLNAAWDADSGDVTVPAVVRRGDLVIAVSTGGKSPSLAAYIKRELESQFGPEFAALVDIIGDLRKGSIADGLGSAERRRRLRRIIGPELFRLVRRGNKSAAEQLVKKAFTDGEATGFVSLVGAGPGDPGLFTLAGRDRLARADAIFYDRLADPSLLDLAPVEAKRIYIGKACGRHTLEQEELNNLLVAYARQGKRVVRLKGGDPFVFGRGGEEASALVRAGIPFEVISGVSSAIAVPAYAGIPITDRRLSHSVAIVTGHKDPADPENRIDWAGLATSVDTLVILMALHSLEAIAESLIRNGRDPGTSAAAIEWGTHADQRVIVAPLEGLASAVAAAGISSPSMIVIGEVVGLRETLCWFGAEGLTRSYEQTRPAEFEGPTPLRTRAPMGGLRDP